MVMDEGFSTEDDYTIEEQYFKIIEEAYDFLEEIGSDLLEGVIKECPTYENRNEIIHELSDILTKHSKIEKYKIENFEVTKAKLKPIPITSIKDDVSMAKRIESLEQKIKLYEHAAESALINAGLFGNKAYINFGKKKYLEASEIWKKIGCPAESDIDTNLSKKFEYYAIILRCISVNNIIKNVEKMITHSEEIFEDMVKQGEDQVEEIITQGENIIENTINKVIKDFEGYMRSQNQNKTRILDEEPYLQQLKKEQLKKFATGINIIKERKRKILFEEKLMDYFDALRDAYMGEDDKFVKFCISQIKKEVNEELRGNSISIFGWPKEQTEDNIARWINAYIGMEKLIKEYIPNNNINT